MALSKKIKTSHGISVENAYIRIEQQSGNKEVVVITVRSYLTKENARKGNRWLVSDTYQFKPSVDVGSENFIKQGYEFLKTLPEFEGAVDIH